MTKLVLLLIFVSYWTYSLVYNKLLNCQEVMVAFSCMGNDLQYKFTIFSNIKKNYCEIDIVSKGNCGNLEIQESKNHSQP